MDERGDSEPRKGLDLGARPDLIELAQPCLRALDPGRAGMARTALGRLELLNREEAIFC